MSVDAPVFEPLMDFEPADFKAVMGRFATGVTIVTTRLGSVRAGLTVNAFCSVSLNPPLVLISIDRASSIHGVLLQAGIFAVNFLAADQQNVSRCFAQHSDYRAREFCGCETSVAATGSPILRESLGFVDCRIVDVFPGGDHSVIIGRVEALSSADRTPLLYFRGAYISPDGQEDGES